MTSIETFRYHPPLASATLQPHRAVSMQPLRFGADTALTVPQETLAKLFHYEGATTAEYVDALAQVKDRSLQKQIMTVATALKQARRGYDQSEVLCISFVILPIFFGLPHLLWGEQAIKRAIAGFKSMTDDNIRYQWLKSLFNTKQGVRDDRFRSKLTMVIPSVRNTDWRDDLIATICREESVRLRLEGVKLLPYLTNPELKEELINKFSLDPSKKVRKQLAQTRNSPEVDIQAAALSEVEESAEALLTNLPHNAISPAQIEQQRQSQQIDQLASDLATRIQQYFKTKPQVRAVLLAQYGNEKNLPAATDFRRHFVQVAKKHLKTKQSLLQRWRSKAVPQEDLTQFTHLMMEMAHKTNTLILPENMETYLKQLDTIQGQRHKIETDLEKARKVVTQQTLYSAQAEDEFQEQQTKVHQLTTQLTKPDTTDKPALNKKLLFEQGQLAEMEKRKAMFDQACTLANAQVDALSQQITALYRQLGLALQYGLMDNSRTELQTLVDKNVGLEQTPQLKQILDQGEDQKYSILADQVPLTPTQTRNASAS